MDGRFSPGKKRHYARRYRDSLKLRLAFRSASTTNSCHVLTQVHGEPKQEINGLQPIGGPHRASTA